MSNPSGWEILSSLSSFGQFLVACWVGWYGFQKYLADEHIEPSDERLELFSTNKQTTELRVTDKGLECHIHDIRDGRGGHQWTLSKTQAAPIKVTTEATSSKAGRLQIGPRTGWLYSYKLWPNKVELEAAIKNLVQQLNA